jgi:2-haloacid dehalogenase
VTKQPNTIVFDIGGVLLDWNPRHLYRKLFDNDVEMETFLRDICSPEWNAEQEAGRSCAQGGKELIKKYPEQAGLIESFDKRSEEFISGAIESTVKLLERLHQCGLELYALTNWSAEKFAITKQRFTFLNYFRDIVVSGDVGLLKPDPKIYKLLLERIDKNAKDCVFIDDNKANIKAAQTLEFYTVQFKDAEDLEKRLLSYQFFKELLA